MVTVKLKQVNIHNLFTLSESKPNAKNNCMMINENGLFKDKEVKEAFIIE